MSYFSIPETLYLYLERDEPWYYIKGNVLSTSMEWIIIMMQEQKKTKRKWKTELLHFSPWLGLCLSLVCISRFSILHMYVETRKPEDSSDKIFLVSVLVLRTNMKEKWHWMIDNNRFLFKLFKPGLNISHIYDPHHDLYLRNWYIPERFFAWLDLYNLFLKQKRVTFGEVFI